MIETYRIESLGPDAEGGELVQRIFVRAGSLDAAKERALRVFRRARVPQHRGPAVETVRVLDGAGYEVFSVSARD
ncbi:MAG TPA: hypothetical protein VHL98_09015 [Microvirga sp.]|nr:hypothetical protein [Microvirga sp.]